MPVGQAFDFILGGKGYMLAREQGTRAWRRTGRPNAVQPRSSDADLQRNALPAEVDFVATYDDFSGGFGDSYRDPHTPNRIHWSEHMDCRFPRQMTHCQQPAEPVTLTPAVGSAGFSPGVGVSWIMQVPHADDAAAPVPPGPVGRGSVVFFGRSEVDASGSSSSVITLTPTGIPPNGLPVVAPEFQKIEEVGRGDTTPSIRMLAFNGRPALWGSFVWVGGNPTGTRPEFRRRDLRGLAGISTTLSPMPGAVFAAAGNRLWRAHGPSGGHVQYLQSVGPGLDPMGTANWGPTYNIGNGLVDVADMVSLDDQIFASTQDGLYAGDTTGTFFNVLGGLDGQINPDNGRNICVHQRSVIYPHAGGLIQYQKLQTAAVAIEIGPNQSSQRSPIRGHVRAVTSYGGWLYGALYTGTQSWLMAGRTDYSTNDFAWHSLQRLPDGPVRQILVDTISSPAASIANPASGNLQIPPRFWVSMEFSLPSSSSTGQVLQWEMPQGDSNPLSAPGFSANYTYSARVDFGRDNRGAPETLKTLRRLDVNTDANSFLSGTRYADVYYTLDGGTRTLLGRAQTSPRTTLYFPSGEGSFTTCYDFELSINSRTTATIQSDILITPNAPVYRSFVLHGTFLSEGVDEITAVVNTGNGRRNRQGAPMRSAAGQLAELRGMAGGPPVRLIDLTGAQQWVTVSRGIDERESYQQGSDMPEVLATIHMAVLTFS